MITMCVTIIIFDLNIVFIKFLLWKSIFLETKGSSPYIIPWNFFIERVIISLCIFLYYVNLELDFIEVFNPLTLYVNNGLCDLFLFVQKVNKIIVCEVHVNAIVIINVLFFMFRILHHWHTLFDVHQKKWQGNSMRDMNFDYNTWYFFEWMVTWKFWNYNLFVTMMFQFIVLECDFNWNQS
jgi:hypothetical protein